MTIKRFAIAALDERDAPVELTAQKGLFEKQRVQMDLEIAKVNETVVFLTVST